MTRHFPRLHGEGLDGDAACNLGICMTGPRGRMGGNRVSGHTLEKRTVCPYALLFYERVHLKKALGMQLGVLYSRIPVASILQVNRAACDRIIREFRRRYFRNKLFSLYIFVFHTYTNVHFI